MASIEQRGPNSWRVGVRTSVADGRKWIRRTVTFPPQMPLEEQQARAELAAAQLKLDVAQGKATQQTSLTVRDFSEIWITDHVIPNCSADTLKNYKFFLSSRILPAIGDTPLHKLTAIQLTRFINGLREEEARTTALDPQQRKRRSDRDRAAPPPRKLSDRTVRHYYDCINYMLNKAVQWQYLTSNPMDHVDRPKVKKRKMKFLDDQQAVQLLRCLAQEESLPFRCAVLLALLCGLRLGEVGALELSDVDWERGTIDIHRALKYTPERGSFVEEPKTESSVRPIDLPAGMMALLWETRDYHEDAAAALGDRWHGCGRIICAWDGTPLHHDTPSKWFRKFADRNGFEGVRFHDLRHSHASILLANNIDAVAVASRLGHADASTTLRVYAHALRRRDQESADAMQRLIDLALNPDLPADPRAPVSSPASGDPSAPVSSSASGDPRAPVSSPASGDPQRPADPRASISSPASGDPQRPADPRADHDGEQHGVQHGEQFPNRPPRKHFTLQPNIPSQDPKHHP